MLYERLDKLAKEIVPHNGSLWDLLGSLPSEVGKVDEEWTKLCSSIGITRTAVRTENEIAMDDPFPRAALLEMSEDTVQKILVLGVP